MNYTNYIQSPPPVLYTSGMSLRDYFAGQVLIGLSIQRQGKTNADDAINAYALADAMLTEREKEVQE